MSEVPGWPIFDFRFWGKWPKWKHFQICFSGFCDGTPNYVSWSNLVKIGRCKVAERLHGLPKKLGICGTRPNRHFCQNGPIVLKIPWTLSPVYMSMCTNFGPDRLRFAGLIPERLIFCAKSQYNIGFQPIIINVLTFTVVLIFAAHHHLLLKYYTSYSHMQKWT